MDKFKRIIKAVLLSGLLIWNISLLFTNDFVEALLGFMCVVIPFSFFLLPKNDKVLGVRMLLFFIGVIIYAFFNWFAAIFLIIAPFVVLAIYRIGENAHWWYPFWWWDSDNNNNNTSS